MTRSPDAPVLLLDLCPIRLGQGEYGLLSTSVQRSLTVVI